MQLFGVPLKLKVSIKGLQGGGFLCATGYCWFFNGEIWLGDAKHYCCRSSLIAPWKRLMRLGRDFQLWIKPKAARTELGWDCLHFGEYFQASPISLYAPLPCCFLGWFEN